MNLSNQKNSVLLRKEVLFSLASFALSFVVVVEWPSKIKMKIYINPKKGSRGVEFANQIFKSLIFGLGWPSKIKMKIYINLKKGVGGLNPPTKTLKPWCLVLHETRIVKPLCKFHLGCWKQHKWLLWLQTYLLMSEIFKQGGKFQPPKILKALEVLIGIEDGKKISGGCGG